MAELNQNWTIPIKTFAIEETENKQFLKIKFHAISEGRNLNNSSFDLAGMEECIAQSDYALKPILGSWQQDKASELGNGDFGGHDSDVAYDVMSGETYNTYLGEKNERPLGLILSDTAKIEEYKGKKWLSFEGAIWAEYNKEAVRLLKKRRANNVSVEIRVLKEHIDEDGVEIIERFTLLGITIIGVQPGIPDAHLSLLEFSKTPQYSNFVRAFSKQMNGSEEDKMEVFLKKEQYGSGDALKLALSKEKASNDSWGGINKTKLRNDLLRAKNYKSLIPKAYLVVMEDWEDAPSDRLKYPIVQIKEGEVVLNINGVQSAGAYLMKEKDEPYFSKAKSKLNKIRKILGMEKLMSLQFGVETNDDLGDEVSQNQPSIIKMEGGSSSNMDRKEITSKMAELLAKKKVIEDELDKLEEKLEEMVGDYEYAEEDKKDEAKTKMDESKAERDAKYEELKTCEKSIMSLATELVGIQEDIIDQKERDAQRFPKIDDEEEMYPVDEEGRKKYCDLLGDGLTYVSNSKNHLVYEKDGELYCGNLSYDEEGILKMEGEVKCEKVFATIVVGGPMSKDDVAAMPKVNVEITKGFAKAYEDIRRKDAEIAEIQKDADAKVEEAKQESENYKVDVKAMLNKYEEITSDENVSKEFKDEVYSKVFDGGYKDVSELETRVKASLYEMNKGSKVLGGSFCKPSASTTKNMSEDDRVKEVINKYKNN